MADTIREQIIAAFVTRAGFWLTAGGFTHNCGSTVQRGIPHVDENDLPACIVLPQIEEVTQQYGVNACKMILRVEAVAAIGTTNPSIVQEQLLGDVITVMTDPRPYLRLTFAEAGYTDAVAGDIGRTVTGAATSDTGTLISYDNTARTWVVCPTTTTDAFDSVEVVATDTGTGTTSGAASSVEVTTLIDDILYTTGGPASGFQGEDTTVAVFAEFTITYETLSGNPYSQGS